MAKTTCKKFTYAKYASGGAGSAISYTGGTMLTDYLAKVDITEERSDDSEYADGHLIDSERIPVSVQMVLELVNNNSSIKKDVLGLAEVGSSSAAELQLTDADPPYVGAGCLMANRHLGTTTWEGYWIYKIQFTHNGVSAETRRDRTAWQHDTISGKAVGVQLSSGGATVFYAHKDGLTESAATTWLQTHAGISSGNGG